METLAESLGQIYAIAPEFAFDGAIQSVGELRSGHINNTFCLTMDSGRRYLLQRVNGYVFKDPEAVMRNIEYVTAHLKASLDERGLDAARRVLTLIPVRSGGHYTMDEARNLWRAYRFIDGATAHNVASNPTQLYEAGRAFGEFQERLSDFEAEKLTETIVNFHNTPVRLAAFEETVDADPLGRVKTARDDIDRLLRRGHRAGEITGRLKSGELPMRVTHNDTKINNVMIDDVTGEALCVIDLDTVMPGSVLYDFGDAIRFGAASSVEDEHDTDRMFLDMNKYRLFTDGFLSATGDSLTALEREMLPVGAWMMTYELTMRFLGDYLNGDQYFEIDFPEHNLVRARAQAALLFDMEARLPGCLGTQSIGGRT